MRGGGGWEGECVGRGINGRENVEGRGNVRVGGRGGVRGIGGEYEWEEEWEWGGGMGVRRGNKSENHLVNGEGAMGRMDVG